MLLTLDSRISPFWFLPVLFAVEVVYWWLRHLPRKIEYTILVVCLVVGGFCFVRNHAFHDVTFLVALVWYGVGKGLKDFDVFAARTESEPYRVRLLLVVATFCFCAHGVGVWFGLDGVVSYACGKWINPWVHFPICLLALLGVLCVSGWLVASEKRSSSFLQPLSTATRTLCWIGRNSMVILAVHSFPGIYRRTWVEAWGVGGAMSYALEVVVLAVLVGLLVKPLRWLVRG